MSADDILARISALEARVAELEAVNARLVDVSARLFDLIADRTLAFTEEIVTVDQRVTDEAAVRAAAIRTRAPRGFTLPIKVYTTVVKDRDREFWADVGLHYWKTIRRVWRLEDLLVEKGVISGSDHLRHVAFDPNDP